MPLEMAALAVAWAVCGFLSYRATRRYYRVQQEWCHLNQPHFESLWYWTRWRQLGTALFGFLGPIALIASLLEEVIFGRADDNASF